MTRHAFVVLGFSLWFGGALSAQPSGGQGPPSFEHRGKGRMATLAPSDPSGAADTTSDTPEVQAATASFEALPAILTPGQEVNVRNTTGRATRGKVVSISDNQLVIARPRGPFAFFRRREEVTFAADVVGKIDIVDSTWDGAAIGAAAAIGVLAVSIEADCRPSCDDNFGRPGRWALLSMLYVPIGMGVGAGIDGLMNRTVYEAQPQRPRLTVTPWLGRDRGGILGRLQF